ncbi:hypothetical protein [Vulcanococcus limneticus]|uniref:hypothetical protein n=1 Tax=Vulcanococcus limneticus TaxID=2170428 RepID=UPI00398BF9C8
MALALRLSLMSVLALIGLAGLVQLPLAPPLASRPGAGTDRLLSDLEGQESAQESRERASAVLSRFVGGQITRYFWGGFSGYLDVLGVEAPEDMEPVLRSEGEWVQLTLVPDEGDERYVARVEAVENVPRGVACAGRGEPGPFPLRGGRLGCPQGWWDLPLAAPGRRAVAAGGPS